MFRISQIKKAGLIAVLAAQTITVFGSPFPLHKIAEEQVTQEKAQINKDFERRKYFARASYGILIGGSLWFAYKWGMFDFLWKKEGANQAGNIALPEKIEEFNKETILPILTVLIARDKAKTEELKILKDEHDANKGHWLINGIKYVGVAGFSMIAGIVVQSKWKSFFDYALAEPTFDWFLDRHSMLAKVESLRFHVNNAIDPDPSVPNYVVERHLQAIAPALELLYKNLLELISFSEFYTDKIDAEILKKYGMDSAPRFIFNTANDFFIDLDAAFTADNRAKAILVIDTFKLELTNYIKDCRAFENAILGE